MRAPLSFNGNSNDGWRAAEPGQQIVRLIFDQAQDLHRIRVVFVESAMERTQEFSLRWSPTRTGSLVDIIRQRWNFSPSDSTVEVEDYKVELSKVLVLELSIHPDLDKNVGAASIQDWRLV
jgi:hypothetical protein